MRSSWLPISGLIILCLLSASSQALPPRQAKLRSPRVPTGSPDHVSEQDLSPPPSVAVSVSSSHPSFDTGSSPSKPARSRRRLTINSTPKHLEGWSIGRKQHFRRKLYGAGYQNHTPLPPEFSRDPYGVLEEAYNMRITDPKLSLEESIKRARVSFNAKAMTMSLKEMLAIPASEPVRKLLDDMTDKHVFMEAGKAANEALRERKKSLADTDLEGWEPSIELPKADLSSRERWRVYNQRAREKRFIRQQTAKKANMNSQSPSGVGATTASQILERPQAPISKKRRGRPSKVEVARASKKARFVLDLNAPPPETGSP